MNKKTLVKINSGEKFSSKDESRGIGTKSIKNLSAKLGFSSIEYSNCLGGGLNITLKKAS